MSFFSNFFKCCESNQVIQNETKNEIQIIPSNLPHKDNYNLPNTPKISEKTETRNVRNIKKELSFFNLEVCNKQSSPLKKNLNLDLNEIENIDKPKPRKENKELSMFNLEVINPSYSNPQKKTNQEKLEENFEEFPDVISFSNENIQNQSPKSLTKKKKNQMKMEMKYATLGEFEINNIEKEKKHDENNQSPRFTTIKTLKSMLNEEDCDIALAKKPFKKFQTTQDGHIGNCNNQIEELINLKKQLKAKNNVDGDDVTPIFDDKKKFDF